VTNAATEAQERVVSKKVRITLTTTTTIIIISTTAY
jgi:hypothetical protein